MGSGKCVMPGEEQYFIMEPTRKFRRKDLEWHIEKHVLDSHEISGKIIVHLLCVSAKCCIHGLI